MDAFPPGPKSKRAAWPPKVKESLKSREPDVLRSGYNPMRSFAGFVAVPDMKRWWAAGMGKPPHASAGAQNPLAGRRTIRKACSKIP